jgi:outer membrane receptor protein involved in Fe transport
MNSFGKLLVATASLSLLFGASPGWAQTGPPPAGGGGAAESGQSDALQEIVVTAQKRTESMQAVPIAITAISSDQLRAAGVTSTMGLQTVSPGLNLGTTGDSFLPHLRGVGSTAAAPGNENSIALYVDGVYYANQIWGIASLGDTANVAVLKGPQGTLFGRNATGGVIQIDTRNPSEDFRGDITTSLDNFLTTTTDLFVTGGVTDTLASSLAASYVYQAHGWGTDTYTGEQDVDRTGRNVNLRNKWFYTPGADTSVMLSLDYMNRETNVGFVNAPYPGTRLLVPGYVGSTNPWDADPGVLTNITTQGGGASVTVNQELPFAHLVSISAYRQLHNFNHDYDVTATPVLAQVLQIPTNAAQITQEIQLVSPSSAAFKWTTGLYYFNSHDGTGGASFGASPFTINLAAPLTPPTIHQQISIYSSLGAQSYAAFGQATVPLAAQTNLTLGLRYTQEHKTFNGRETLSINGGTPGPLPLPAVVPSESFDKLTWRFSLDHQIADDVLAYISANRGFKSGGYNGFAPTNPPYNPEVLDAYEMGLKSEWLDHHVRVNGAAFFYNYSNIQVSKYTNTAVIYNGAGAHVEGLDLDAQAKYGNFRLSGGLAWLHSRFTSFPNAQFSTPRPTGGATLYSGNASGNELPLAPTITADVSADYVVAAPFGSADINVTDYYNHGWYPEADNYLRQPAYDLLSVSVTLAPPDERFTAKLWANNLLNKPVYGYFATQATGYFADPNNPPRSYGITLAYKFGKL